MPYSASNNLSLDPKTKFRTNFLVGRAMRVRRDCYLLYMELLFMAENRNGRRVVQGQNVRNVNRNVHRTSTSTARRPRRRRFTRIQVIRNRVLLVIGCVAFFWLAYLGVSALSKALFAGEAVPVAAPQSDVTDSSSDVSTDSNTSSSTEQPPQSSESSGVGAAVVGTSGLTAVSANSDSLSASDSEPEPKEEPSSSSSQDTSGDDSTTDGEDDEKEEENTNPYPGPATPMLVNKQNPIPADFAPNLVDVGEGYQFDATGAVALKAMMSDAAAQGINLYIVSAYRSIEHQTNNYNNRVQQYINEGKTQAEAEELTERFIAPPDASEHSLGLAVDFNSLYQSFEETTEFDWLVENCAKYGFILRYPKEKTAITGYSYEPWHYRFVGTNHAEAIMSQGLCLEEYL